MIIVTNVNTTSKRAVLQKVTVLLNSTTKKRGFYLNKTIVFGVFLSQRSPWISLRKTQIENIDVQVARAFLSKLHLT